MRSALVLSTVYILSMPILILSLVSLILAFHSTTNTNRAYVYKAKSNEFRAIPEKNNPLQLSAKPQEARVDAIKKFLSRYKSPLLEHSEALVAAADTYGIDYRLLVGIAMQESTLCKKMPVNSYNCWGWGIYGGKVTRFASFSDAIETISRHLSSQYKSNGLSDPAEIVSRYTPANTNNWAENVQYVMERIESTF